MSGSLTRGRASRFTGNFTPRAGHPQEGVPVGAKLYEAEAYSKVSREVGAAMLGSAAFKDPVETLDCQAQTCPRCSHASEFMHIHRTNWFKRPLGGPVLLVICSLVALVGCRDAAPGVYQLQSSSMAPHFQGPRYRATCQNCDRSVELAVELAGSGWPTRCPYCGGGSQVSTRLTPGERIQVSENEALNRLDVVAIKRHDQAVVLKRIWGLPGERLEIANGEVWVDGKMFQKSLPQLRRVAVPLFGGNWVKQPSSGDSNVETQRWCHKAPAPVYPDESDVADWLVAAPITDELPGSPGSGKLATSEDVYLRIELQQQVDWLAVEYFYHGELRSVLISESENRNIAVDGQPTSALHFNLQPKALTEVAFCDGRVLIDDGNVISLVSKEAHTESHQLAEIAVSVPEGTPLRIKTYRDLIFRSTHPDPHILEQYSTLGEGQLFVLGDNQPISQDSRNELGPIQRDEVLGVVKKLAGSAALPNR